MSPRTRLAIRLGVSSALLGLLMVVVSPRDVLGRLTSLELRWVAVAVALSVVQVAASAWRWRFTARRLGAELPASLAVTEYYLASFLNQVLPGGVAGDVTRAWRHADATATAHGREGPRRAVNAVILERVSGQLVMTSLGLASAGVLLWPRLGVRGVLLLILGGAVLAAGAARVWGRTRRIPLVARFAEDARVGLFARHALPLQVTSSLLVVGTYVGMYLTAAAALGVSTPLPVLAPLVAPVLVTMLLPVSVAGWGVREATAAALWGTVGLAPGEGMAISLTYGLLVLLSSLPGAALLAVTLWRRRGPGRREDPSPVGSDALEGA